MEYIAFVGGVEWNTLLLWVEWSGIHLFYGLGWSGMHLFCGLGCGEIHFFWGDWSLFWKQFRVEVSNFYWYRHRIKIQEADTWFCKCWGIFSLLTIITDNPCINSIFTMLHVCYSIVNLLTCNICTKIHHTINTETLTRYLHLSCYLQNL